MEDDPTIEEKGYQWMRGHLSGFLRFDGERVAIKIAPLPDGRFVAPVMVAMLMAADTVMELPDDGDTDLHLMMSLEKFDERTDQSGSADRWRTYHGDPPDVNWAWITIDAAKFQGYFIDGEVFQRPNTLDKGGSMICRALNQSKIDTVRAAIHVQYRTDAAEPLVVGVDPSGFDIRRQFDIIRLNAPEGRVISDEASAVSVLTVLAKEA